MFFEAQSSSFDKTQLLQLHNWCVPQQRQVRAVLASLLLTASVLSGCSNNMANSVAQLQASTRQSTDSANAFWQARFAERQAGYLPPTLELLAQGALTPCGLVPAPYTTPQYCTSSKTVFVPEAWYQSIGANQNPPAQDVIDVAVGTFAGIHAQITDTRPSRSEEDGDRVPLRAVCYSGVWSATLTKSRVASISKTVKTNPEGIWSGYSKATVSDFQTWFGVGLSSGDVKKCDEFSGKV
jgi:uncharacterized protein